MAALAEHPTVKLVQLQSAGQMALPPSALSAAELRALCLAAGADDCGFVEIGRPALDDQRADILAGLPRTRTLISFVLRMNREHPHADALHFQCGVPSHRR